MIGEHKKVLICMCQDNINEVIDEESGQTIDFEIVQSNDYIVVE